MTVSAVVNRDKLKDIFDIEQLEDTSFKVTITSLTDKEADEIEFKSLKGIAGRPLDLDEVRKERLNI